MKTLSIIFPTYNEEKNVPELYRRSKKVLENMDDLDYELVFIDDCSTDRTSSIIEELRREDNHVHLVRFARNSGSHAAVAAGISVCRGDAAVVLAADLQDPPEMIPNLLRRWSEGSNVVWGVRKKREGVNVVTRVFSRAYYYLMNRITDIRQPPAGADVVLIDRLVIDAFKETPEKNTSVIMLIAWLGFSQTHIEYVKESRYSGLSKWSTSQKLKLFFDSLVSFSYTPLRLMSFTGVVSALLGMIYGIHIVFNAFFGAPIQGWSSLMIVVLLLGGFQMIMMGMLGEYLWRTYDETRGRPRYVIEKNTLSDR